MSSKTELKSQLDKKRFLREATLAERLSEATRGESFRAVGHQTGYNSETIRRYLQGLSSVPADFVGRITFCYDQSGHFLLTGTHRVPSEEQLRLVTTDRLINEIGRRMLMIENSAVGSVLIRDDREI